MTPESTTGGAVAEEVRARIATANQVCQNSPGKSADGAEDESLTTEKESKNTRKCYLKVTVFGRKLYALLDTGCEISLMGQRLFPDAKLQPTPQKVFAVGGMNLPICGKMEIRFSVGVNHEEYPVLVTTALSGLVLGLDWLQKRPCQWDFERRIFTFRGKTYPLFAWDQEQVRHLYVA